MGLVSTVSICFLFPFPPSNLTGTWTSVISAGTDRIVNALCVAALVELTLLIARGFVGDGRGITLFAATLCDFLRGPGFGLSGTAPIVKFADLNGDNCILEGDVGVGAGRVFTTLVVAVRFVDFAAGMTSARLLAFGC